MIDPILVPESLPDSPKSPESFFDLSRDDLTAALEPAFRATQLFKAVYKQWIDEFDEITSLPKSLRTSLKERWNIQTPPVHRTFEAEDGTRRHLIRLADGEMAETVFIPEESRNTICVSSQVGCPLACAFCLTGQLGFVRHLSAGEIVSQVLVAQRENLGPRNTRAASDASNKTPVDTRGARDFYRNHFNIVLMGMGEPLHNYDNVMKALAIVNDPSGLNISMSRISLSTAGLIPELKRLSQERLIPNVAVSLTGATDATRDSLMPINRTYPIGDLVEVLRNFPFKPRQFVMLEYVLLRGVTDAPDQARDLARIARKVRAKVNLIPLNESPDLEFKRPDQATIVRFHKILMDEGIPVFVRKSRGDDISAACGQLKKKWADSPPQIDLAVLNI